MQIRASLLCQICIDNRAELLLHALYMAPAREPHEGQITKLLREQGYHALWLAKLS